MADMKALKEQIQTANALGIANLEEKGVSIPQNATTYEIMESIAKVEGSGKEVYEFVQTLVGDVTSIQEELEATSNMIGGETE